MAKRYRVGPCHAFFGDFLDDTGAFTDVTYLGQTRGNTIVRPEMVISRGKVDQKGAAPIAGAIHLGGYAPVIELPFVDEDKTKLSKIFPGSTVATSGTKKALKFATTPQQITNASIGSLMLVPVKATYSDGPFEDQDAYFFPGVIPTAVAEFIYGPIEDTDDGLNPHATTLVALHRELFADDSTAVPAGLEVFFMGSPTAAGLTTGFDWTTNAATRFAALIAS